MHRQNILKLLDQYQITYPNELKRVKSYREFILRSPGCFKRSNMEGHVTGSSWLLNAEETHVLLTHHKKLNIWIQLGGHADGNPDVQAVSYREAQEESGIPNIIPISTTPFDIDIHRIPDRPTEPSHLHFDMCFLHKVPDHTAFVVSNESHSLAWVEIKKIVSYTQETSMLRMAQKWENQPLNR